MQKSVKVLAIDDSPFILKMVRKALEHVGYEIVATAENGKQGLEKFKEHMPDVVTVDITMPIMDGIEFSKHVMAEYPDAKIIMISAMGDDELVETAKKIGIKNFVMKPFEAKDLQRVVEEVLEKSPV